MKYILLSLLAISSLSADFLSGMKDDKGCVKAKVFGPHTTLYICNNKDYLVEMDDKQRVIKMQLIGKDGKVVLLVDHTR